MRPFPRLCIALAAALIPIVSSGQVDAWENHSFQFINNSSTIVSLTDMRLKCVSSTTQIYDIYPGNSLTINWTDSNSIVDDCTNRDKFVAYQVRFFGWSGWLGITHRKFGSTWYNGQFYAASITMDGFKIKDYTDGPPPPDLAILALCPHDNACLGPFSEIEMAGKDSYNWPRVYQTESGWAFEFQQVD